MAQTAAVGYNAVSRRVSLPQFYNRWSVEMPTKKREAVKNYGPVLLYIEDVLAICSEMQEIPGVSSLRIQTPEYLYSSQDDLMKSPEKTVSSLAISTYCDLEDPHVYFSAGLLGGYVSADINSLEVQDGFQKITEIVDKCVLPKRLDKGLVALSAVAFLLCIILVIWLTSSVTIALDTRRVLSTLTGSLLVFAIFSGILAVLTRRPANNQIYLYSRPVRESFWKNNRDKVLVEVIKVTVGVIVGALLTLGIQALQKKP